MFSDIVVGYNKNSTTTGMDMRTMSMALCGATLMCAEPVAQP